MAKTKSMTRNQNQDNDDASSSSSSSSSCSRKRIKTFDNGGVASWSDLNHDVLFIVLMQLGVVDFIAFSGVCTSWRSYALSNNDTFMACRLPMSISIFHRSNDEDSYYYLEDSEGRRFKTILPNSASMTCVGLTCGYLFLFGRLTHDFRLVNPITRHQLHFPDYPLHAGIVDEFEVKVIIVFSPSISRFVFVMLHRKASFYAISKPTISYYIEGKRRWNHVSFRNTIPILDLHVFKGKIYTLHSDCSLGELKLNLNQKRKWTLLETKYLPHPELTSQQLGSSNESLFVINGYSSQQEALKLDFGEKKWVSTIGEYAFFISVYYSCAAIKPESWADLQKRYKRYEYFWDENQNRQCIYYKALMWYFPHDCLNVSDLV